MKRKVLSVLMIIAVLLCYMPSTVFADEIAQGTSTPPSAQQIGDYYEVNDTTGALPASPTLEGKTQQSYEDGKVLVDKTIKGTNTENVFDVTLKVTTKDVEIQTEVSEDAAVVLVIDVSGSMDGSLYFAQRAAQRFINSFASTDAKNVQRKIAIVKFSGEKGSKGSTGIDGAKKVQSWTEASNLASKIGWGNTPISWCSAIYGLSADGGTNLEAGLQLAKNLLNDSKELEGITNKSIVLLTDGNPTYGIDHDKEDNYTTATNVICGNGKNMIGNGGSTAHQTHTQAETLANTLNSSGINTFAIYLGREVVNCTDNNCNLNTSGSNWLATKCKFTTFSVSNADQLELIFEKISEMIKLQTQAWILTDPMGENIDLVTEFTSDDGNAGITAVDDVITWNLKQSTPNSPDGSSTIREYSLTYQIKLDNLKSGFTPGTYYPTNGVTSLTYLISDDIIDSDIEAEDLLKTAYFNIPSVKGMKDDLSFTKLDAAGNPLSGAGFTLSTTGYTATATSDDNGNVSFTNIPSGHTYKLEETTVPTGYVKAADKTVKVSYGKLDSTSPNYDGKTAIVNESANTSVSVTKVWNDRDNQDGIRPDSITIRLLADGTEKESKAVTAADNWSCTFDNLPKMANGQAIAYTVSEDEVTGYGEPTITGDATLGYTITNTHTPETISVEGTKTWSDGNNQDVTRPESITIRLLANGVEKDTATVTADTDGNWTYSFTNLPKYANGQEIRYTITEDAVAGYTQTINGYDVTNSYTPGKTSVTVTKAWDDSDNQDGKRPDSITIKLLADGTATDKTVTLNAANSWTATFTDLDVNSAGNKITYTVEESSVPDGYTSSVSGDAATGFTITNTHTPETITVSGTKTWDDNNNAAGERPTSITVKLLANNVEKTSTTVTADNNWKYSFTNLPKYANGQEITYTVSEEPVADYTAEVDDNNIKNTYDNNTSVTVSVSKAWDDNDNQANKRPASVTVKLLKNGIATGQTVTLDATNEWKDSFRNLEKYKNGVLISYTVEEVPVENYNNEVTGSVESGFTVTNTYAPPKTSVTVTKIWDHGENTTAANQPTSVTIKLFADGADTGKNLELTARNAQQDGSWKGEFTGLDKYAADGKVIEYTITEEAVDGYVSFVNGYTVTNAYNKTSVSVSKVWDHGDNKEKPTSVTVNLLANDTATGDPITLSEGNNWSHTFTDLTRYDDSGKEIVYTVSEENVPNYRPEITRAANSFTITNTYIQSGGSEVTPEIKPNLIVTKTFSGINALPNGFKIEVSLDKAPVETLTTAGKTPEVIPVGNSTTYKYTWEVEVANASGGEYTVEEQGITDPDYDVEPMYKVTGSSDDDERAAAANAFEDVAAAYTKGTSATVSVNADGVSTVDFINTYTKKVVPPTTPTTPTTDKFRLTLNKQVLGVDNLPADYAVTVTVSNKFGPVKVLTLKANEPQTIYLSRGDYTLTENAPAIDGYTLKSQEFSADSFYLTYGGQDVTITNTYAKDAEDPEEPKDNKDQDDKNPPIEPKDPSDDNGDDESDVPKTGDSMSFFLYVLTAAGALLGLKKLSKRETE